MYIITATYIGKLILLKKNNSDGYDVHQTISDLGTGIQTCDMSSDHQYAAYHDLTSLRVYKFNSGTTQFDPFQTISVTDATSVSLSGDGEYLCVGSPTNDIKIFKNDGSTYSLWKTINMATSTVYFVKAYLQDSIEYLIVPDRDTTDTSVTATKVYKFNSATEEFDLDSEKVFTGYN